MSRLRNHPGLLISIFIALCFPGCGGSGNGEKGSAEIPDTNTPPIAVIRIDRTGGPSPLVIHADASASSDMDNAIAEREWDFGDGVTEKAEYAVHTYTSPGTYDVSLTVTDADGASGTDSVSIVVGDPSPAGPEPPPQLGWGLGGSEYTYLSVIEKSYGSGATRYWLFEPDDPSPVGKLPIVVFIHGFTVIEPSIYREWIGHIVKRGNMVIFPQYQDLSGTPPSAYTANAIIAIKDALEEITGGNGHPLPELGKCALVGHSWGGVISANIAALAPSDPDLPRFSAVQCTEPGTGGLGSYEDYSRIPPDTLLLTIAGADDALVGDTDARRIYVETTAIPPENKDYILARSDDHGSPAIFADHSAPTDIGIGSGAIRWFGFWKWFDGLYEAAFYGINEEYALGNSPEQKFMGYWSDGTPVTEPVVTDNP